MWYFYGVNNTRAVISCISKVSIPYDLTERPIFFLIEGKNSTWPIFNLRYFTGHNLFSGQFTWFLTPILPFIKSTSTHSCLGVDHSAVMQRVLIDNKYFFAFFREKFNQYKSAVHFKKLPCNNANGSMGHHPLHNARQRCAGAYFLDQFGWIFILFNGPKVPTMV